jgi:hypothetical protein
MTSNLNKDQPVSFNLAMKNIELIGTLLDKAAHCFIKLDNKGWYINLKAAKLAIISRLNKEERANLTRTEKKIQLWLGSLKPMGLQCPKKNETINKSINAKLQGLIEEYDITIKEVLEKHGYLIPSKRDRSNLFGQGEEDDFEDEDE